MTTDINGKYVIRFETVFPFEFAQKKLKSELSGFKSAHFLRRKWPPFI